MYVLGIETSCDETAAAIVTRDDNGAPQILSDIVLSQVDDHSAFGGVVPEIAARAHLSALDRVIEAAVNEAGMTRSDIDAVAATGGPGLIGGLIVGLMTAKGLAASLGKPFLAVNHLEAHALTARLTDRIEFPYLLLLVSGGHTQIVAVEGLGQYRRWATTIDDALGEAFDKTAKLLSLGFPGGPAVERTAMQGDPARFDFPRPLKGQNTLNFSFSGLKTAIRQEAERLAPLKEQDVADLCAAFQAAVRDVLVDRASRAMDRFEEIWPDMERPTLVVAGGVAANQVLRGSLAAACGNKNWRFVAPPLKLCGDNAVMVAWAGLERFERGEVSPMSFAPRSRWPLDEDVAAVIGSGKRGVKA
ncbi:MAG: tRNA (adenosine(37)-N6)-threonylcarbamoyltransferase complex transferase subunit TsaD [Salaquimonas sp.]|nr:tRNA (adenosine(37)-N6)-threonylcarbamoyltransferase complex transferase subunit TsaD [Salaquimonas sp.]